MTPATGSWLGSPNPVVTGIPRSRRETGRADPPGPVPGDQSPHPVAHLGVSAQAESPEVRQIQAQ
jgi:hypothetical protein